MNVCSGKIKDLEEKETKTGKIIHKLTLEDGSLYSGWGEIPVKMQRALDLKVVVEVQFKVNGSYKNILKVNYPVMPDPVDGYDDGTSDVMPDNVAQKDVAVDMVHDATVNEYVEIGEEIMDRCRKSIELVIGHAPVTDGECASVNSLFIFVTQRLPRK